MANNSIQSKSNAKLKSNMDAAAFQANLYNQINRLNLFQTIDQSLIFNSGSASSLPQSKLLAESSSSLDEDFNDEANSDSDGSERDDEAPVKQSTRRVNTYHNHHHHHHNHPADESDLCDQEIINIFNIDNRSCLVSINSQPYSLCCAKTTPTSKNRKTNGRKTAPTTTTGYVTRPSLDFEKMIKRNYQALLQSQIANSFDRILSLNQRSDQL